MRRVPPPPGARKGAPPPIPKTTVKPVEVDSLPDNNQKVEQAGNKIEKQEPQLVNQLPVTNINPQSKVEEQEEVPKKVQAPLPRTKPPAPPVKRTVPSIPQKSKPTAPVIPINPPVNQVEEKKVDEVVAPQVSQPEPAVPLKQPEQPPQPKQTKPTPPTLPTKPVTQKPIQQPSPTPTPTPPNSTFSKPQSKTTQINTLKSKLDEVLNARSLLLESSQQSQQQEQQNTDIIPVENPFFENDDNVSGGERSDPFEEINQGSNSSSAKEIKQQNGKGEQQRVNGATQTIEAEPQQYRDPNYNPFADQYEKQQNKQGEQQLNRNLVPQSVQIPLVQLPQAVEQNKPVEKSLEHASQAIKKEQKVIDLKEYIALLRERQREMNNELNNTHNRLVVQEQDYINRIELLKLQLQERNQRIESLKGK